MTTTQKQLLLNYLGYDTGGIDGLWGPRSQKAEMDFRSARNLPDASLESALKIAVAGENIWDTVKYFTPGEFYCKCGCGCATQPDPALLRLADQVRAHFNSPCIVSSGVRCEAHNKKVGGVANSRHLTGKAMDFSIRGKTAVEVLAAVQKFPAVRYAYAIDKNYVHMDVK